MGVNVNQLFRYPQEGNLLEWVTFLSVLTISTAAIAGALAGCAFLCAVAAFIGAWILSAICAMCGMVLVALSCISGALASGAICTAAGLWWINVLFNAGSSVLGHVSPSLHAWALQKCQGTLTLMGFSLKSSMSAPTGSATHPESEGKQAGPTHQSPGKSKTEWVSQPLYEEEGTGSLPLDAEFMTSGGHSALPERTTLAAARASADATVAKGRPQDTAPTGATSSSSPAKAATHSVPQPPLPDCHPRSAADTDKGASGPTALTAKALASKTAAQQGSDAGAASDVTNASHASTKSKKAARHKANKQRRQLEGVVAYGVQT